MLRVFYSIGSLLFQSNVLPDHLPYGSVMEDQVYKKASSYIAQYPVLRTVQITLHDQIDDEVDRVSDGSDSVMEDQVDRVLDGPASTIED